MLRQQDVAPPRYESGELVLLHLSDEQPGWSRPLHGNVCARRGHFQRHILSVEGIYQIQIWL